MTASKKLLARRMAAFTVAAVTLVLAFSGIAIAAPAPSDCAWQQCDLAAPPIVDPDPTPEPPVEPEPPVPSAEAQPTAAPTSPPAPVEESSTQAIPQGQDPVSTAPEPVREAAAENAAPVRAALVAGLAATLLGGGWLASALTRRLRHEE